MNIALWVAQGLAALVFLLTGALKDGDAERQARPEDALGRDVAAGSHQAARPRRGGRARSGWCSPPRCTSRRCSRRSQRSCLAVLMLGAVQTHRRLHESVVPALVLVLVCVAIAAGRFRFGAQVV